MSAIPSNAEQFSGSLTSFSSIVKEQFGNLIKAGVEPADAAEVLLQRMSCEASPDEHEINEAMYTFGFTYLEAQRALKVTSRLRRITQDGATGANAVLALIKGLSVVDRAAAYQAEVHQFLHAEDEEASPKPPKPEERHPQDAYIPPPPREEARAPMAAVDSLLDLEPSVSPRSLKTIGGSPVPRTDSGEAPIQESVGGFTGAGGQEGLVAVGEQRQGCGIIRKRPLSDESSQDSEVGVNTQVQGEWAVGEGGCETLETQDQKAEQCCISERDPKRPRTARPQAFSTLNNHNTNHVNPHVNGLFVPTTCGVGKQPRPNPVAEESGALKRTRR